MVIEILGGPKSPINRESRKARAERLPLQSSANRRTRRVRRTTNGFLRILRLLRLVPCRYRRSGWPVEASTALQSVPVGSTFLRSQTAREIGTWVNWWFQKLTTMLVRPVMPA